jgi:hypothetical protein
MHDRAAERDEPRIVMNSADKRQGRPPRSGGPAPVARALVVRAICRPRLQAAVC